MKKLTEPQRRALFHLAKYPGEWRQDTPVKRQSVLNNLKELGYVIVALDQGGWYEMITPEGIDIITKDGMNNG